MAYSIDEQTIMDIHNAICARRGKSNTYGIKGSSFASAILKIDAMKKMYRFSTHIENGGRGLMAANCAATYLWAKYSGNEDFVYKSSGNLFSGASTKYVRDANGKAMIDCSTLVSLCLRDINYSNSPYAKHKGANATWVPANEISDMYGAYSGRTLFQILDKQPAGYHNDLGISGYSTIRTAGDLAEFFYRTGCIVYDVDLDGAPTVAKIKNVIAPGDIIFWAYSDASESQSARFRGISHTAIAGHETGSYIQAGSTTSVVSLNSFEYDYNKNSDKFNALVFIIRPDWRWVERSANLPKNQNCLSFPWSHIGDIRDAQTSYNPSALLEQTYVGVTVKCTDLHKIKVSGTSTGTKSLSLRGDADDDGDYLYLDAGTYELSGMSGSGITSTKFALQLRTIGKSEIGSISGATITCNGSSETQVRAYDGHEPVRFTLPSAKKCALTLYWGSGVTLNATITPTLKRVE